MVQQHSCLQLALLYSIFTGLLVPAWGRLEATPQLSTGPDVSARTQNIIELFSELHSSDETCDETYGFLPCTSSVLGNIFLVLVYGSSMFFAAKYMSDGSEILLQVLGPGIIGGLFLPLLGALPDSLIILASGLSGSTSTAQSQVSVGMGLLAGTTVMLLTVLWGSCVIVGKCDMVNSVAKDSQDTKGFSLRGSGISVDVWTKYAARIMVISIIPFVIVELPAVFGASSDTRLAVLIALIVSICALISYCSYQILQPWIQKRRLAYVKQKHVVSGILNSLNSQAMGRLVDDDGEPNTQELDKLFTAIDGNQDGLLSLKEFRALLIGIQLDLSRSDTKNAVNDIVKGLDMSQDSVIQRDEFIKGVSKWLKETKQGERNEVPLEDQGEGTPESSEDPKKKIAKAVALLLLGTLVAAVFADPLVDAVDNFSTASGIPSFFVSFVVLPFASSSEAVSSLIFARKKKLQTSSLTFSEIYGSVTISNLFTLAVFLGLVYFRGLSWDFSSEVLIILIVCVVMGVFASLRTTFELWTALVAVALYPLSILLIYVLVYVIGWS